MIKQSILFLLTSLSLVLSAQALAANKGSGIKRTIREPLSHEMLVISQSVGTDHSVGLRARVGYVTSANKTMTLSRGSIYNKNNIDWKPLKSINWDPAWTASEALAVAKQHVSYFTAEALPAIQAYMNKNKLPQGWYSYQQWIKVTGLTGVVTRLVTWSVFINNYGSSVSYGNPVLLNGAPTVLQASYSNLTVAQGLPPEWTYADAGVLKVRVLDSQLMPLSDWTVVSTGGLFDQPPDTGLEEENNPANETEAGVRCIVEGGTGCPQGVKSLKTLMADSSSIMAFLDYTFKLEPAYDDADNALIELYVTKRKVDRAKCSDPVFINEGMLGYSLNVTSNRYFIGNSGESHLVDTKTVVQPSPVKTYSKTVTGFPIGTNLNPYIITPEEGKTDLILTSDIVLKALATLDETSDSGTTIGLLVGQVPPSFNDWGQLVPGYCTYTRIGCSAENSTVGIYYGSGATCTSAGASATPRAWLQKGTPGGWGGISYNGASTITITGDTAMANALGGSRYDVSNLNSSVLYGVHGDFAGSYGAGTFSSIMCDNYYCAQDEKCTNQDIPTVKYNHQLCKITGGDEFGVWQQCTTQSLCTYMYQPAVNFDSAPPPEERAFGRLTTSINW